MKNDNGDSLKRICAARSVSLDITEFQPKPHYLLILLERAYQAGISALFIRWGELFPWTADRRFRSETAYPEEIVYGLVREAEKKNIEIVPFAPLLGDSQYAASFPCYRYVKANKRTTSIGSILEKCCVPLFEEMVEDIISLMPSLKYIAVPLYRKDFDHPDELRDAAERIRSILMQFSFRPLFILYGDTEKKEVLGNSDLLQLSENEVFLGRTDSKDPGSPGKRGFSYFEEKQYALLENIGVVCSRGWSLSLQIRELLIRMGLDRIERYKHTAAVQQKQVYFSERLSALDTLKAEFLQLFSASFEEVLLRRWISSKMLPLEEEYALLSARISHVHPEIIENNKL